MFFILVPFLKRAPCIIIHLARNAEKGGGVLISIILPNLNHSFVPVPVPFPDSGSVSGFRISGFSIRPCGKPLQPDSLSFNRQSHAVSVKIFCICGDSFKWLSSPIMGGSTPKYYVNMRYGDFDLISVFKC